MSLCSASTARRAEQQRLAEAMSFTFEEALQWAIEAQCGYVGDRIAAYLAPTNADATAFAVGFVSVMAGTMLAAQSIKEILDEGPIGGLECRAVMQFLDPNASSNRTRLYARQPDCSMCDPSGTAAEIWRRRHAAFQP